MGKQFLLLEEKESFQSFWALVSRFGKNHQVGPLTTKARRLESPGTLGPWTLGPRSCWLCSGDTAVSLQLPALAVLGLEKVDVARTTSRAPDARSAGGTCLFLGGEVVLVCLVFEF